MNQEFFNALDLLEKTKGIPKAYMIEKVEAALISAFKKEYGVSPKQYRENYQNQIKNQ